MRWRVGDAGSLERLNLDFLKETTQASPCTSSSSFAAPSNFRIFPGIYQLQGKIRAQGSESPALPLLMFFLCAPLARRGRRNRDLLRASVVSGAVCGVIFLFQ